jgi:nitroreductase
MNDLIRAMMDRRSIRKFQERQLDEETLAEILSAGSWAPNAGGRQSPLFVVCQNAAINEELGRLSVEINGRLNRPAPKPGESLPQASPASASAFYGAPTVVTIFAPKNWHNFTIDCGVAAQNMVLAAHSLGVGSCIIARALELFETETGKNYMRKWNIGEDYEGKIHVILGYRDGEQPEAKPRKEGRVIRIN